MLVKKFGLEIVSEQVEERGKSIEAIDGSSPRQLRASTDCTACISEPAYQAPPLGCDAPEMSRRSFAN